MKELFAEILNISISAGILIVACVLVRLLFRNMPKFVRCLMWLLVAVRLAIPFTIESPLSLLPAKEYVTVSSGNETDTYCVNDSTSIPVTTASQITSDELSDEEIHYLGDGENHYVVDGTGATSYSGNSAHTIDWMYVLSIVWIIGVFAVLTYAFIAYIRLKKLVSDAVLLKENIYQSERTGTAFVLGIISPKIYVPYGLTPNELYMSISHEKAHLARRDHLVKPLGFIITAVYWFNPLIWLAYILLCRDIELACDEKVIKKIGYDKKKDYSQALLNLSIPKKYISACPVAFGEVGINERVKNVLKMKKGKKIIIAAAALVCAALGICFLTYPRTKDKTDEIAEVQASEEQVVEESTTVSDEQVAELNTSASDEQETEESTTASDEQVAEEISNKIYEIKVVDADGSNEYEIASITSDEENTKNYILNLQNKNGEVYSINLNSDLSSGLENGNVTLYLDTVKESDDYVLNEAEESDVYLVNEVEGSDDNTADEGEEVSANLTVSGTTVTEDGKTIVVHTGQNEDNLDKVYIYSNVDPSSNVHKTYDTSDGSENVVVKLSTGDGASKEIIWPISGTGNIVRRYDDTHQGTDIGAVEGTDVISVFDGTVEEVGFNDSEGNFLTIMSEQGWKVKYSHLQDNPKVSKGDKVETGDVVGAVGNTGQSTGPHLHLELYNENGESEAPILLMTD